MTTNICIYGDNNVGKTTLFNALSLPKQDDRYTVDENNFDNLINKIYLYDYILYVIDPSCIIDYNKLARLRDSISEFHVKYNGNIKLGFIINKCDILDYSIDNNNTLILNTKHQSNLDKMKHDINGYFNDATYILMSAELAYIFKAIFYDYELKQEYIDKLGTFQFGRHTWIESSNKSYEYKKLQKLYKKSREFDSMIQRWGMTKLNSFLIMNEDEIMMAERCRYNVAQIFAMQFLNNESNYKQLLDIITEIVQTSSENSDNNSFDLKNNISTHILATTKNAYIIENICIDNIDKYSSHIKMIENLELSYPLLIDGEYFKQYFQSIRDACNSIYCSYIDTSNLELSLQYAKKLYENNYELVGLLLVT